MSRLALALAVTAGLGCPAEAPRLPSGGDVGGSSTGASDPKSSGGAIGTTVDSAADTSSSSSSSASGVDGGSSTSTTTGGAGTSAGSTGEPGTTGSTGMPFGPCSGDGDCTEPGAQCCSVGACVDICAVPCAGPDNCETGTLCYHGHCLPQCVDDSDCAIIAGATCQHREVCEY
jgi:hypothetical protein